MPGLPTIAVAANLPGYESASTSGIFAPAGASPTLIKRLHEEVSRVLSRSEVKERIFNQSLEVVGGMPEEVTASIKSDMATTAKIVQTVGIRADR